jgi:hypothetical protein
MSPLSLVDAFGKFGAKPNSRLIGQSAMATDGAMVLNCSHVRFGHPAPGVLRYEDRLSRNTAVSKDSVLLGQHLALARDGALPIRLVVETRIETESGRGAGRFHVRPDLIGKIVTFDGDHFVVDFTRLEEPDTDTPAARRK